MKKIALVGFGGVGGYIGTMLAYAGNDITVVARNERAEILREKGLILHSELNGERSTRNFKQVSSVRELNAPDILIICVKNFSLETVLDDLKQVITDKTIIIPIMNGVDPGLRVRKAFPMNTVIDSLIYIVAFANDDFSISQVGDHIQVIIGRENPTDEEKKIIEEINNVLVGAGINSSVSDSIQREIWMKYITNCALNVETAAYDITVGQIRNDEIMAEEYEKLLTEAYNVGRKSGVNLTEDDLNRMKYMFYNVFAGDATSSLQRDINDGKEQCEIDTFSGYIVKQAEILGVDAPVSLDFYRKLLERHEKSLRKM